MRNPCQHKSIALDGIVKDYFATGLFYVETPQLDSVVGPRIELALKRFNYEHDSDVTWKQLGQAVWTILHRGTVDTSKVSRIKNGEQEPTIAEGGAFSYLLNVSPSWLFWGIGEMGRFPGRDEEPSTDLQHETPTPVTQLIGANRRRGES